MGITSLSCNHLGSPGAAAKQRLLWELLGLLKWAEGGYIASVRTPFPLQPHSDPVPTKLLNNKSLLPSASCYCLTAFIPVKQVSLQGLAIIVSSFCLTPSGDLGQKPRSTLFPLMSPLLPSELFSFFKHIRCSPASEPLHWLFPMFGMLFP